VRRIAVCLFIILVLSSCVTSTKKAEKITLDGVADFSSSFVSFMRTLPAGGAPIFFAAAPRMSDREAEIDGCLASAAAQASKFIAAQASSYFLVKENNRDLFYLEGLDVLYDTALAEELLDDLTILRELQDRNGSYILARLDSHTIDPIPYTPSLSGKEPAWVKVYPSIKGYYVGIGVAQRAGRFDSSIADADDRAMEEIIKQMSVSMFTDRRDIEVDNVGTAFAQDRTEFSDEIVLGFYVLARWVSPDGSNYYSLAVCPRDKNTRP